MAGRPALRHDWPVTALDDLEAELAAVAAREPAVRAWTARHSDDELRAQVAGAAVGSGPLAGWTLGVKDVIDTADLPTGRGSPIYTGRRPTEDAACVALARAAGAVVAGKTTTTEFALFTPTATANPHDPTRTPGGSSSGSAAAVAAGMVRAAFGTQTVGSVLRPAAFCGVTGFKGSHGAVPMNGVGALAPSLDTLGWHTRSVADAAALHAVLTGAPHPDGSVTTDLGGGRPPRLGLYRSHVWSRAQPELEPLLAAVAERLRAAGADVVELDPAPHLAPVVDAGAVILAVESALAFAWERAHHAEQIHPRILRLFAKGDRIDRADHHAAQRAVAGARAAHDRWLHDQSLDALLTPSAPGEAVPIDTTGDSIFNATWSTLGVPAIQLPVGVGPLGLPLGSSSPATAGTTGPCSARPPGWRPTWVRRSRSAADRPRPGGSIPEAGAADPCDPPVVGGGTEGWSGTEEGTAGAERWRPAERASRAPGRFCWRRAPGAAMTAPTPPRRPPPPSPTAPGRPRRSPRRPPRPARSAPKT